MQVLVVGIDAGCLDVLEPRFEEGRLPTLQGIFEEGASGPLESHIPPWTPSMWPSINTGVNPGKHGAFSFLDFDGYDWDIVDASTIQEPQIWELLDECGLSSVVVNVPVSHPERPFDGALVPGYLAPENPDCHPKGILDDVEEALGRPYQIYPTRGEDSSPELDEYQDLTRLRGQTFRYLSDRFDPDFGYVQFQLTDTVFHEHPGELDLVDGIYETVDEEVATIIDRYDPDTVVVVSDHGIGKYEGYGFRMNTFLEEHGYVETTYSGGGMPSWVPARENRLRNGDTDDGVLARCVRHGLDRAPVGVATQRVGSALDRLGLRDSVARVLPSTFIRAGQQQVDFECSTAYMRARIELGIRINLEGREPAGKVPQEDYEDVRTELIELLSDVETPDGEPLFDTVARREEYFEGDEAERAVDIVTVPADFDHFLTADLLRDTFGEPGQPWNHKRNGIVAIHGEGVDATADVGDAHVFDIAPTLLALFGQAKSDQMDGDVLPPVTALGERTYADREETIDHPSQEADLEDRLADLGYLDN